jgi:hypothetical protein
MGMRRTTILSLTAAAALAAAPAAALAHNGGGDHEHGDGHGHGHGRDATPVATVASFSGGTLTLTLTDGSTLAAKVTDRTHLTCEAAVPTPPTAPTARKANFTPRRHHGHGFGRHRYRPCSTDNLTTGAKITDAEVSVTTSGAVFREVDLVQ